MTLKSWDGWHSRSGSQPEARGERHTFVGFGLSGGTRISSDGGEAWPAHVTIRFDQELLGLHISCFGRKTRHGSQATVGDGLTPESRIMSIPKTGIFANR